MRTCPQTKPLLLRAEYIKEAPYIHRLGGGTHATRTCVQGGTLFKVLDDVEPLSRDPLAPFRMSVIDRFKDMGTIAMGKSEAGLVRKNDRLYVMPNKCARHSSFLLLPK